jgi:hypothetical protein
MFWQNNRVLKGSDDGVWHSGLLGFSTLSIVTHFEEHRTMKQSPRTR